MFNEEKLQRHIAKYPRRHCTYSEAPFLSRRRFFEVAGAGVGASYLTAPLSGQTGGVRVTTKNTAKYCIFVLMSGAPSHVDTFDCKVGPSTPADLKAETKNGVLWPTGAMPQLANHLGKMAIVRSMRAWALVHSLGQTWTQIGRNPAAALGDVSPNMGSVVASEKDRERTASQVFPSFLALNSNGAIGPGYFPASYAPFKVTPATTGLPNTSNTDGKPRSDARLRFLKSIDDPLRLASPLGKPAEDYDKFYAAANGMMFNAAVDTAFRYSAAESQRYGVAGVANGFGNACLVAKQVLAANQGTRFIQISLGGWDMHNDIYGTGGAATSIFSLGKTFDAGMSALLGDLDSAGLLKDTLVVMVGEFGRTVGAVSASGGRDHYLQHFAAFAGAGVKGGKIVGATDATGARTTSFGWPHERDHRPEDVLATVYSAMGIDWTKQLETPYGRTFEYVPDASHGIYLPMDELWT
ncbi:MAG: DUF1501 domain-containing protein [Acidobacteria bacterium]|nr:DUF1501 domain-containing protein [Acidobacteriota bacterium]